MSRFRPTLAQYRELRSAIDEAEGALMGLTNVKWERLDFLYDTMNGGVIVRLPIRVHELMRLKRAQERLTSIINSEEFPNGPTPPRK